MQQISAFVMKRRSWILRAVALIVPVVLLVLVLSQTAFAQITYVITDGDEVRVHTTRASDPETVLHEAGVQLDESDTFTTQAGAEGTEITVRRGQIITIDNCGEVMQASSYGEDVGSLLERLGVSTGGQYQLSVSPDTMTRDGMEVKVSWVVEEDQTYTAEIPFETVYCDAPTMEEGAEVIASAGVPGQALRTEHVTYVNGEESERTCLEETVTLEPVQQVVLRGTGTELGQEAKPIIGNGVIVLPSGEVLTYDHYDYYKGTAYTSFVDDTTDMTATGTEARVGAIAVDPTQIPYGTRMFIVTNDGEYVYGVATAEDCGGGVKGKHVDLFFDTVDECWEFGVRRVTIYFLGGADWRGDTNWRNK